MVEWDNIVAPKLVAPDGAQLMHDSWSGKPSVSMSDELRRVLDLPRRGLELDGTDRAEAIIDMMMERFARPVVPGRRCRCAELDPERHAVEGCIERFRLPQAQTLREIGICGGAFCPIGVGHGKSLIDLIAPLAFRYCDGGDKMQDFVVLVPPGLAAQLMGDYEYYGQHFKMPEIVFHGYDYINTVRKMNSLVPLERGAPTLHVVTYSRLSRPENTVWLEQQLKPAAIIADECFPYDTPVLTDAGLVPIGDIVERGVGSAAWSMDTSTRAWSWRPIVRRLRNNPRGLVRVVHAHGEIVCTGAHKIWTSNRGYVPAAELAPGDELARSLQAAGRSDLPEVPQSVLDAATWEVHGSALQPVVRSQHGPERETLPGTLEGETSETYGGSGCDARTTREMGGGAPRQDVHRTRRQRPGHGAARHAACLDGLPDGVRDPYAGSPRALPSTTGFVQGGPCRPDAEDCDRGRRSVAPHQEMEISGSAQNRNFECSRVDRVEVLERRGPDRSSEGALYDLEVGETHNYVAAGVLVSNCHKLRYCCPDGKKRPSATGARMWRYMEEIAPQTRFVGLSGSMTSKDIEDYWHLAKWSLRGSSPLPRRIEVVQDWGRAINPSNDPANPGPLMELCRPGEHLHAGFKRRIAETVGVVTTAAPAVDVPLTLRERAAPPIPADVQQYLDQLRDAQVRPDGEELLTALEVAECAMQVSLGFYYRFIYPDCEFPRDEQLVLDWRAARREFFREVRNKLKNLEADMDSPRLVINAAERFYGLREKHKGLPLWHSLAFPAWNKIRGLVRYEKEAVCFNDYIVRDIAVWAQETRGIVWYEHNAIGEWVAKLSGLPKYGGGKTAKKLLLGSAKEGIKGEDGSRSVLLSVDAHGTGTNGLQHRFTENLILHITPEPNKVEQTLGRTHRPGQVKPVNAYFYRHTEALRKHLEDALAAAYYVENTGFGSQKILRAWKE